VKFEVPKVEERALKRGQFWKEEQQKILKGCIINDGAKRYINFRHSTL
jgi:hypothetical protein